MIRIEHEITLPNDIDEVFLFIANAENNPKWDTDCIKTKIITEMPIRQGTEGESVLDILGKTYYSSFTYDQYDPPHLVSRQIRAGHIKMKVTNVLKDVENGTELTRSLEFSPSGPERLVEPFIAKKVKKHFQASFERLKLYFRLKAAGGF